MLSRTTLQLPAPWRGGVDLRPRRRAGRLTLIVSPAPGTRGLEVRGRAGAGLALLGWWIAMLELFLLAVS